MTPRDESGTASGSSIAQCAAEAGGPILRVVTAAGAGDWDQRDILRDAARRLGGRRLNRRSVAADSEADPDLPFNLAASETYPPGDAFRSQPLSWSRRMSLERRAAERLAAMLEKADALLKTYTSPPDNFIGFEGWVDSDLFAEWRTQSLVLLSQCLGADHGYTRSFEERTEKPSVPSSVKSGMGVLRAASEDLVNGYLFGTRSLIEAEVFSDFLEIAQHLLDSGYKDPAASLAGAVLEDGLRRVCSAASVPFKKSDGLDALNTALAKGCLQQAGPVESRYVAAYSQRRRPWQLRRVRSG